MGFRIRGIGGKQNYSPLFEHEIELNLPIECTPLVNPGSLSAKEPSWALDLEGEVLPFTLGGRDLMRLPLHALTLMTPFTQLTTDVEAYLPPWDTFPSEIDVAVVPALPVIEDLPRLTLISCGIRYVSSCTNRYFIDLQRSFSGYLQKFRAKPRHNLTRTIQKFAEYSGGKINWREFNSPEEMSEFRRLAIDVSRKTWQEHVGGPGFPRSERFRKDIIDLAEEELARGYVLFHSNQPISYVFCRAHENCLLYARTAYDQSYAEWSPGTVLLYVLLERLFGEDKFRYLDFGEGTLSYKRFFSTDHVRCARIIYFRMNFASFVIALSHCGLSSFSQSFGRVLKAVKLKERIKGLLMGELQRPGQ